MIIDGKALAREITDEITTRILRLAVPPRLTVFTCTPNFETKKFLALKQKGAQAVGIILELVELPATVTLAEVAAAVGAASSRADGIIIQFPFPNHLVTSDLIALIPETHDVDAFLYAGGLSALLPPVVGAIDEISKKHAVAWSNKNVVIVGNGRLVGAPAALYATARGALVTILTKTTSNQGAAMAAADILILGAGVPGLVTSDMIKPGVLIFDAGTSEEGGMLVGDANPEIAAKAGLFTPVPGGIGPLTIAILLKNVLYLAQQHRNMEENVV